MRRWFICHNCGREFEGEARACPVCQRPFCPYCLENLHSIHVDPA